MSLVTLLRPDQRASSARVRNSACRGYVCDLDPDSESGPRQLRDLAGRVVHFNSLEQAREALRDRGVDQAFLHQHHACEELGALYRHTTPERGAKVLDASRD